MALKIIWHFVDLLGLDGIRAAVPDVDFIGVESPAELERHLPGAEITVIGQTRYDQTTAEIYKAKGGDLRWMQFRPSGMDKAARFGVPDNVIISNAPGMSSPVIAEHVFAHLLTLTRRLRDWQKVQQGGEWMRPKAIIEHMQSLDGMTLAVIGYGAIAQAVCVRAKAFGMRVVVVSRAAEPGPHVDAAFRRERLGDACAEADAVAMCASLAKDTHHLLGAAAIARMKPSAFILNIGRGELIDEAAMIAALSDGRIKGAGLDVFEGEPAKPDNPLWKMENVVFTPHVAARGGNDVAEFRKFFTENLRRYRAGEDLMNVIGPDRLAAAE